MVVSKQKKGTFTLRQAYHRLAAECWTYGAPESDEQTMYFMGNSGHGELGNCCTVPNNVGYPSLAAPGNEWRFQQGQNTGSHHAIIGKKCDGTFWGWGNNSHNKLGQAQRGGWNRSSPSQIPGCWCDVAMSHQAALGVKCDGTLWTWGYGNHGQAGLWCSSGCILNCHPGCTYSNQSYSCMLQVGTQTNWISAHGGYHQGFAIRSGNCAYAWGHNGSGELASGNTTCYSSPHQVPGTWCFMRGYHPVVGKRTDGSHWVWGPNNHGQLGNGNTNNCSSPITLPGTWIVVADGGQGQQFMGGIKNDNTLWMWGHNNHGQLGQNNTTNRSSPVKVPGNWIHMSTGHRHVVAIKCDGTLWGWGHNSTNQRYHCSGVDFSSPIQLPGCNWKYVQGGWSGTWLFSCGRRLADDDCKCVITS